MITRRKVIELIDKGEGVSTEFKQRFSGYEKVAKEMIAFANTAGGYIFFGVNDNKTIYGLESERADLELIKETAEKYCEPPVQYLIESFELERKDILAVEILESKKKPHRLQDYQPSLNLNTAQVFVRMNDKSVPASKEMIKLLQSKSAETNLKNYIVGGIEKSVFEFLDVNETISVKQLCKHANISERRASRTLIKLVRANLLIIHQKDNGESYFSYFG